MQSATMSRSASIEMSASCQLMKFVIATSARPPLGEHPWCDGWLVCVLRNVQWIAVVEGLTLAPAAMSDAEGAGLPSSILGAKRCEPRHRKSYLGQSVCS